MDRRPFVKKLSFGASLDLISSNKLFSSIYENEKFKLN